MDKLFKYGILAIVAGFLSYALAFMTQCLLHFSIDISYFITPNTLVTFGILYLGLIVIYVYNRLFGWSSSSRKKRILAGGGVRIAAGLENASFMTQAEAEQAFRVTTYRKLVQEDDGILLKCEVNRRGTDLDIWLVKPIHTMTIGTTGSGKTETDVMNSIRCLAHCQTKPSFIISDPKGELRTKNGTALKAEGYEVLTLDLRNPYESTKWNPLETIYDSYQRSLRDTNAVSRQIVFDELYEELNSIAGIVCPVLNKNDIWDGGAKNYVLAILMAMLEDSANARSGMTKARFNFYNMSKIAFNDEEEYELVRRYFNNRDEFSKARALSSQVLGASENTFKSYLSTVADKLLLFNDRGICSMTSKNEISIANFDETPTAVFLLIPDERETRHPLASLFIMQSYKELVKKANGYANLALKRHIYYILDEFGNLPTLPGINALVTVGRSRGIFLCPYVQSYAQLENKYGKEVAAILKSNCNIKKYIGTDDKQTNEEFASLLGNYTIVQSSVSGGGENKKDLNVSDSIHTRPLIYPTELAQLNNTASDGKNLGNTIISQFGYKPIQSKFTPFFKNNIYNKDSYRNPQSEQVAEVFDEQAVLYNIDQACSSDLPAAAAKSVPATEAHDPQQPDDADTERDSRPESKQAKRLSYIAQVNELLPCPILNDGSSDSDMLKAIIEALQGNLTDVTRAKLIAHKRRIE